ncbi:MAG: DUF192 domain-containing protein [Candidatus Paceibacterota bacterium]|jgi:hypothetical protein
MKKIKIIIFFVAALLSLALFFVFRVAQGTPAQGYLVCFGKDCYSADLAKTPEERQKGLMFRSFLAAEEGMLFVFEEEEKHSFWMKNTLVPLDIIWINSDKKVSYIASDVQPCESDHCPMVSPLAAAQYVFEMNAGEARRIGLKIGDEAVLP